MALCLSQDSDGNPVETESMLEKRTFQICSKLCIVFITTYKFGNKHRTRCLELNIICNLLWRKQEVLQKSVIIIIIIEAYLDHFPK